MLEESLRQDLDSTSFCHGVNMTQFTNDITYISVTVVPEHATPSMVQQSTDSETDFPIAIHAFLTMEQSLMVAG
jgi:hypothetical protein